ncbi:MAG: hypothetical protein EZS28_031845 [Streblomastix strix]|uniref:Uncharacterized protein n=1 Tax=Streblomastix strix TaxID=222440 RepID=A0A5J4UQE6_9EUKA|nr:MAG: hypothetical protein EZS28_031845 [Streblomastix strix]
MAQFVIILLILTCALFAQCTFKTNSSIPLASGLACFRSISLSSSSQEFTSTNNLVKTYMNSYAFKDTSLYPNANGTGYDQPSVDIFGGLDEIEHTQFNNTFDFYEHVMVLLNKLKDAHTYFVPPFVETVPLGGLYSTVIFSYSGCGQKAIDRYEKNPLAAKFNLVIELRAVETSSSAQRAMASEAKLMRRISVLLQNSTPPSEMYFECGDEKMQWKEQQKIIINFFNDSFC